MKPLQIEFHIFISAVSIELEQMEPWQWSSSLSAHDVEIAGAGPAMCESKLEQCH